MSGEAHILQEELELLALGALPEDEAARVRLHVSGCGDCGKSLAEARGIVALLAFSVAQEKPGPAPKARLMARIAAERVDSEQGSGASVPAAGSPSRQARRRAAWWNWVLVPATALLALFSLALWRENNRLFLELREAQRMAASFEQEHMRVQKLVNALAAPETITVKLSGTPDAVGASGVVKYNSQTGLVVYMAQLPPLPADKVYQMWLVPATGAPISAGVFTPALSGQPQVQSAEVPGDTASKAFAVTIEPAGGRAQPTGPRVLLGAS